MAGFAYNAGSWVALQYYVLGAKAGSTLSRQPQTLLTAASESLRRFIVFSVGDVGFFCCDEYV